jgi:hypothetical protein
MHTCMQALEPNNAAAAAAAAAAAYDGSLEGSSRGGSGRDGRDGQQKLTMGELFPGLEPYQQDAKLQEVGLLTYEKRQANIISWFGWHVLLL